MSELTSRSARHCMKCCMSRPNLVPRASFPLTSGQKTRALGAIISGMRHRCRCAVNRTTRIRLFPLFFHNGCSPSSRFPTTGQGERSSGSEIGLAQENKTMSLTPEDEREVDGFILRLRLCKSHAPLVQVVKAMI